MNNTELGKILARELFKCGDEEKNKVQRIQFMGGSWPDNETSMGGFCESALADFFIKILNKNTPEARQDRCGCGVSHLNHCNRCD